MKILLLIFLGIFSHFNIGFVNVQLIQGIVTDSHHNPVPYAHIGVIGKKIGTISNEDGTFELNISGIEQGDSLFISSVGFETHKIASSELSANQKLTVRLKEAIYKTEELTVTGNKAKLISFGRSRPYRSSGWRFSGIATGNEVGRIFKNKDRFVLTDFRFHVESVDFDSLLYRFNIYEINEKKFKLLNKQEIMAVSDVSDGWIEIKFNASDNILIKDDFAVAIELVKGWINGKESTRGSVLYTGRSSLQKNMIQRSHQFHEEERIGLFLSMVVNGIVTN